LINSDEVQSKVNAPKDGSKPAVLKCNPLKSGVALEAVNPAGASMKKRAAEEQAKAEKAKKKKQKSGAAVKALGKKYYRSMVAEE